MKDTPENEYGAVRRRWMWARKQRDGWLDKSNLHKYSRLPGDFTDIEL